jgi:GNAT superfamily N-acetyltransferase
MTCRDAALAAWAAELGTTVGVLGSAGTTVLRHGPAFAGRRVAFALATGTACVVTVPDDWYATAAAALGHQGAAEAFDATRLAGLFGPAVRRVVGPAWQGHVDAGGFAPVDARGTRLLSGEDRAALDALAAACPPGEWEASSIDPERPPLFGRLVGGALVAAGTLAPWRERFWNVGIVTHPEHRRRGHGRAVVSAMTRHGLDQGWLLHYQTLLANRPSVAVARSLGYRRHARTLAIRLTPA